MLEYTLHPEATKTKDSMGLVTEPRVSLNVMGFWPDPACSQLTVSGEIRPPPWESAASPRIPCWQITASPAMLGVLQLLSSQFLYVTKFLWLLRLKSLSKAICFPFQLLASPLVSCCCCSVIQWCLTLGNPMDCSLPGSSIHEILQARVLECVASPSSRGSFWPRDRNHVSYVSYIGRWVLYH